MQRIGGIWKDFGRRSGRWMDPCSMSDWKRFTHSQKHLEDDKDFYPHFKDELSGKPAQRAHWKEEFPLELGGSLPEVEVMYEEWGKESNPCVLVIPALSMGSHVHSSIFNPLPGWWEGMIGPHKAIDTNKYHVICPSILGGPFGTTSPLSINPKTNKVYGPDFPQITTKDQARCHKRLLDHLGISKLHGAVGASLGGMQVLSFASTFPESVERIAAICCTGKTSPGTVAFRRVQRRAIMSDPKFKGGYYDPKEPPSDGLAIARELGTIVYRSREEFDARFGWDADPPYGPQSLSFPVEKYLDAQATRFSKRFDANCYLLLSRCMDLMDLGRGCESYEEGVRRIQAKTYILAYEKDILIPLHESKNLANCLASLGKDVKFETSPSIFGHDAFLKEITHLTPRIRVALH